MARVGVRRVRKHRLFWPGVVGVGYLAVVVAVTAAEYVSELQKLSGGSYTDTFSPFLFSELLTFPSNRLFDVWPGYDYSTGFDADSWRDDLQSGLPPLAGAALCQAAMIFIVVWAVRKVATDRRSTSTSSI